MDLSIENVEKCMKYNNSEERDVIKQFFTNPSHLDNKKRTIVFSTPSETGTSYFRIFEPMRIMWKQLRDEANFIYTENIQPNHIKLADLIIMHRASNLHSHFLSVQKMWPRTEQKPLIIHDVDDNEFNLPKVHPMRDLWYASKKDKMSVHALTESDAVITTTEKLRQTFSNLRNSSKSVFIRRNMFDWDLPQWNLNKREIRKEMIPEFGDDKIVIGWAGLTSHFEDIKRMHASLKTIHDKYPNTVFVLAGMALKDSSIEVSYDENGKPIYKEKAIEDEAMLYRNRVKALYSDIDENRIKIFDALPLEKYGKFYTLFDISLAYIEHNTFNKCKSEIKVIESLRYGAVPVFSDYGGYNDFWKALPSKLKLPHMAVSSMMSKSWSDSLSHWVEKLSIKSDKKPMELAEQFTENLTEYVNHTYNLNENVEEQLMMLLTMIEDNDESEVNRIAKISKLDIERDM